MTFEHATTREELARCFPVIIQLRPKLVDADEWCERAIAMRAAGYRVLACAIQGDVQALAGYRISENLIYDRFPYVDDLVAAPSVRGRGLGARLLDELSEIARNEHCARLVLDTSAANTAAQRFYRREGLLDLAIGFSKLIT